MERLDYRVEYEDCFREYIKKLRSNKPVIVVGDMNVAYKPIDLKRPTMNEGKAGYTKE